MAINSQKPVIDAGSQGVKQAIRPWRFVSNQ
jgi:hypothetical protein